MLDLTNLSPIRFLSKYKLVPSFHEGGTTEMFTDIDDEDILYFFHNPYYQSLAREFQDLPLDEKMKKQEKFVQDIIVEFNLESKRFSPLIIEHLDSGQFPSRNPTAIGIQDLGEQGVRLLLKPGVTKNELDEVWEEVEQVLVEKERKTKRGNLMHFRIFELVQAGKARGHIEYMIEREYGKKIEYGNIKKICARIRKKMKPLPDKYIKLPYKEEAYDN